MFVHDHRRQTAAITAIAVVGCWLVLATGYCYVHGVLERRYTADLGLSLTWSVSQWGSWLVLAPALVLAVHRAWPYFLRLLLLVLIAVALSLLFKLALDAVVVGRVSQNWQSVYLFVPRSLALLGLVLGIEAVRMHRSQKSQVRAVWPMLEVRTADGCQSMISQDQIRFVRASGNYVEVEDGIQTAKVRSTLHEVQGRLDPERFLRVHRSFLVNLDFVHCVERVQKSRRFLIRLKGVAPPIPVSPSGLEALRKLNATSLPSDTD